MSDWSRLSEILGEWWVKPELEFVNALPARATFEVYSDAGGARAGREELSRSLDGRWRFDLVDGPSAADPEWIEPGFDDAGWSNVDVPGVWTRQGFDRPHYTNLVMPWGGDPPSVPKVNPTGLYRTTFRRPTGWARRRTVLEVGAAESMAAVFVNGHFVGICSDSRLRTEFDITDHVVAGVNTLAIAVVRWSAFTWLEDQDQWFHGGLHRSVGLRSRAAVSIGDVRATSRLTEDGGRTECTVWVDGPVDGHEVRVTLETLRGRTVAVASANPSQLDRSLQVIEHLDSYRHPGPLTEFVLHALDVEPWSHERPQRYRLVVELLDSTGGVVEATSIFTGFTHVEVGGRELRLNGEALLIAGVNRHDHHPVRGKTQTSAELRDEVAAIRRAGFNAVRTAHYPPDPMLLDRCDELGLWVVLEANVESHARWRELPWDRRYQTAFMSRVQRAVAVHFNHPSIYAWSLGNESGYGPVHDAGAAWVRHVDPHRVVQYEGSIYRRWSEDPQAADRVPASDVICPMYPQVSDLERWARESNGEKPLILAEYSHAMGNSNGGLAAYWEAFRSFHGLQGGFVWDWRDQGLEEFDDRGRMYWAYGGHFGDEPNDGNYCCNGLVGPDGEPHPAVEEHRRLTQPVVVEVVDLRRGRFRVVNRRSWTDLGDLVLSAAISVDGVEVWSDEPEVGQVPAGGSIELDLDLPRPGLRVGQEVHLSFSWRLRRSVGWARAGHLVSEDQFRMPWVGRRTWDRRPVAPVTVDEDRIEAGDLSVQIDRDGAALAGLSVGRRTLLEGRIELGMWRAPTDNDGPSVGPLAGMTGARPMWLGWGLDGLVDEPVSCTIRRSDDGVGLVMRHEWTGSGAAAEHVQRMRVRSDGVIEFSEEVIVPRMWSDLPRVGVRMRLPARVRHLEWFGRGPEETYPDRCSAPVGRWRTTVERQYVPYVMPQHHGSHVDSRWAALSDRRGNGLLVWLGGLTFDASVFSVEDLTRAQTLAELDPSGAIHLHIDGAIRGVGTGACGPDTTSIVRSGRYRFTWAMVPLSAGDDPGSVARSMAL